MNPLPSQTTVAIQTTSNAMPSIPAAISLTPPAYSTANRRSTGCGPHRAYPWLLCASTLIAATFCLLYITKPVILASQNNASKITFDEKPAVVSAKPSAASHPNLLPKSDHLPGDQSASTGNHPIAASPRTATAQTQPAKAFEETNLRIQHILTAEAPGGNVARIDIEVPVLYHSRNLRWTTAEVEEARALLVRLTDYQEKSRALRSEGVQLLDSWNHLVERSIPTGELRADSPTLPVNQQDAQDVPRPAGLNTTDSIQIQSSGK